MTLRRGLAIFGIVLAVLVAAIALLIYIELQRDPLAPLYADNCAVCHGVDYRGAAQGPALVGAPLVHGDSVDQISASISNGFPGKGMPGWSTTLEPVQIRTLAILIAERRIDQTFTDFKVDKPLVIPDAPIESELVTFRLETVASNLDPLTFSIAPLADGRILLTEKVRGLSIISADGVQSEPISGTPETSGVGLNLRGLDYGLGWLLDVAPHPDYENNGWIYLAHTHICRGCFDSEPLIPRTMNRIVRGRILDGAWVDEEVIWQSAPEFYSQSPDIGAGGRLALDPAGYVFMSIGIKGLSNYAGIQDLRSPYGKILRLHDDGRIPIDNPFFTYPNALPSIWTYGHRSPQGLEFDANDGALWETEMGPRGGDEVNLLQPGLNYGWPLYSKGVDYDGTPVEYWKELKIEFDINEIVQPVVDITPSPAASSFIIYAQDAFPAWRGHFLVGMLKGTGLYRFVIENGKHISTEVVIRDLARVRDIEQGPDGLIYLLLEHEAGSLIVRMVPES